MKHKFLLGFIILLAFFLRFIGLGSNPPSLSWDEVAWGYNAYSLGIDGRDEFGRFLPLDYLESFGDYKPPVYAYLDVIPVKFFGLNEMASRFPSALFGSLTVLLTFLLTREIFYNTKNRELYALSSALILAISPWHIMLSRAAFEANVSTFFIVFGVWSFLYSIRKKNYFLLFSVISFVISVYTFNTARIVSPLLFILLSLVFRKELINNKKNLLVSIIVGLVMLIPFIKFLPSPQASLRFREVNIFSDPGPVQTSNYEIKNDNNAWFSKVIHNRRLIYSVDYLKHYLDNLSPSFLFIKGDGNPKFSTQDVGELFLWDLPFFIAGFIFLFKKREGKWWLIPVWLLIGIIPAATARETPHALRIETTLPTFQIITSIGFINFYLRFRKFLIPTLLLLFINFFYFLHGYIFHYAREFSGEWQYGYKDSIAYVEQVKNQYSAINITEELGRPYIYYLFYTKQDPKTFRKEAVVKRDAFGFVDVQSFSKYHFYKGNLESSAYKGNLESSAYKGNLESSAYKGNLESSAYKDLSSVSSKGQLYIDVPSKVPSWVKVDKTFYLLDGEPSLVAYEK